MEYKARAEGVVSLYRDDLRNIRTTITEFPVTSMSEELAKAIGKVLDQPGLVDIQNARALDVGTGCGVHSAVLATAGCRNVHAIDITEEGVEAATLRFLRLSEQLSRLAGQDVAPCRYQRCDLAAVMTSKQQYDIIVTNPPSYFSSVEKSVTPLDTGLYDGLARDHADYKKSFLYQFLSAAKGSTLAPGGVAICTWPALEYRLVHDSSKDGHPAVHPKVLLRKWFGWKSDFGGDTHKDFFCSRSSVTDYGNDPHFLDEFRTYVSLPRYYSPLVEAGPPNKDFAAVFTFGILALKKDRHEKNRIEAIGLSSLLSDVHHG